MIEVGDRVKVKDNYPGPTALHGMLGTVVTISLQRTYPYHVELDGEEGIDPFTFNELELVK